MKQKFIGEEKRSTPILREVDVIVAGGGTAGMIAGLAAAREGAKTVVVERLNCLGGVLTASFMTTAWAMNDHERMLVGGLPLEIVERLEERKAVVKGDKSNDAFLNYDSEMAKYLLSELYANEKNLEVLYEAIVTEAIVENGSVKGIIMESKSGRQAVLGKVVVDATGDADVAARAGAEYSLSPKNDLHPVSLMAKIANVDVGKLSSHYEEHFPNRVGEFARKCGNSYTGFHIVRLEEELDDVGLPKELEYLRNWFMMIYSTPRPGEVVINMTGEPNVDGTDVEDIQRGITQSRRRLFQLLELLQNHLPGFGDSYISSTAPVLGVRETRRIKGLYRLTREDILDNRKFGDAVCTYHSPLFIHTPDGTDIEFVDLEPGTSFDIPFRCLVPQQIDGLIVTGRSISVEADVIGSTRNIFACLVLGQSAGIAAAIAALKGIKPRSIRTAELRKALINRGIYLDKKGIEKGMY